MNGELPEWLRNVQPMTEAEFAAWDVAESQRQMAAERDENRRLLEALSHD